MKWEKLSNGDWIAQGTKGHFLLWKERVGWKGLYMIDGVRIVKYRWWDRSLANLKKRCKAAKEWEA